MLVPVHPFTPHLIPAGSPSGCAFLVPPLRPQATLRSHGLPATGRGPKQPAPAARVAGAAVAPAHAAPAPPTAPAPVCATWQQPSEPKQHGACSARVPGVTLTCGGWGWASKRRQSAWGPAIAVSGLCLPLGAAAPFHLLAILVSVARFIHGGPPSVCIVHVEVHEIAEVAAVRASTNQNFGMTLDLVELEQGFWLWLLIAEARPKGA